MTEEGSDLKPKDLCPGFTSLRVLSPTELCPQLQAQSTCTEQAAADVTDGSRNADTQHSGKVVAFSDAGDVTMGKPRTKNCPARRTSASSKVYSITIFDIHLLNGSFSVALAISCVPTLSRGPERNKTVGAGSLLSLLHRELFALQVINNAEGGEGTRETCKYRKICSA